MSAGRTVGARLAEAPGAVRRRADHVRTSAGEFVSGDRPFVAATVVVIALALLMLAGPVNRWLDGRERLGVLDEQRAALEVEVERLQSRAEDLHDPSHVELLAREQLGLVRPGEVPYVVVVPEPERPQLARGRGLAPEGAAWYRRLLEAIGDVFR